MSPLLRKDRQVIDLLIPFLATTIGFILGYSIRGLRADLEETRLRMELNLVEAEMVAARNPMKGALK
jgi:hypothetical protein